MCGICGIIEFNDKTPITVSNIKKMSDSLVHRGPDDDGYFINEDKNLGLGFRRLSIIDLSTGAQPMTSFDKNQTIVYNGEIYNYLDLKDILKKDGYKFQTKSDTEVILNGYKRWGYDVVNKLRGMFAFAIWDETKKSLFLARDRIGVKPLYFYIKNKFIFASEIKSLLQAPGINKDINEEALYHYLTVSVAPAPNTLFKDIYKLEPGHFLKVNLNGDIEKHCYWTPNINEDIANLSEDELKINIKSLLRESIKIRTMSEVPFGAFLSGGVDSSLNVSLMDEVIGSQVSTFSVAIEGDQQYNELGEANFVANHFNTNHHNITISKTDFISSLSDIVKFQDEPLSDPVSIPLFHVSQLARKNGVYVIQIGEGADELFSGYTLYSLMNKMNKRFFKPFSNLPNPLKTIALEVAKIFFSSSKINYLKLARDGKEFFWGGAVVFKEYEKKYLYKSNTDYDTYSSFIAPFYKQYDKMNPNSSFLDRSIALDMYHRLPELLLMRADKMAMATSVETRVPFLDHKLVELALSIPSKMKVKDGVEKYILKEAARGIIPDQIIDRPKVGFCGSANSMLSKEFLNYAEYEINESKWMKNKFNLDYINQIFQLHKNLKANKGMEIYSLINLCLWQKYWFNS